MNIDVKVLNKTLAKQGTMAHAYNPSYSGLNQTLRTRESQLDASPGKSSCNSLSTNKKLGVVAHTCHPSYAGSINRRIMVQTSQSINVIPYWKCGSNSRVPAL
jgi:hypothetical protein